MAGEGGYSLCLFGICIYFELEIGGCDAPLFTRAIFTFFLASLLVHLFSCVLVYLFILPVHSFIHTRIHSFIYLLG